MPAFCTEMGHVDNGGRIIGKHRELLSGLQRLQTLTRFENWQWAQEPRGIEKVCIVRHERLIRVVFQGVHKDVTARWGDVAQTIR
mgnify:CR=1 FL=1